MRIQIDIQTSDFNVGHELEALHDQDHQIGAVACFVGLVRDFSEQSDVQGMHLEHYPGMTEKSLERIVREAGRRCRLLAVRLIHRVGDLAAGERIVLVAVASAHREDAFEACQRITDALKVEAPFWKKEWTSTGERWVEARSADEVRALRWRVES